MFVATSNVHKPSDVVSEHQHVYYSETMPINLLTTQTKYLTETEDFIAHHAGESMAIGMSGVGKAYSDLDCKQKYISPTKLEVHFC